MKNYRWFLMIVPILFFVVHSADAAWIPSTTDVGITSPLTTSANDQTKKGTLMIGSNAETANLCLNGTAGVDCISGWESISGLGDFVRLYSGNVKIISKASGELVLGNSSDQYLSQSGIIHLTAIYSSTPPVDQRFTAIIQAPLTQLCDSGHYCIFDSTLSCSVNSDCGATNVAVYGKAPTVYDNAAVLNGTTLVTNALNATSGTGRICLAGDCISSWNDLTVAPQYLQLQQFTTNVNGLPTIANTQSGGAVVSGHSSFSAVVLGDATGVMVQTTCGDGVCNGSENNTPGTKYCSVDCAAIGVPSLTSTVNITSLDSVGNPQVVVTVTVEAPSDTVQDVVLVRSSSYPVSFRPTPSTTYNIGDTQGVYPNDYKIVGVVSKNTTPSLAPGYVFSSTDTISNFHHGKTYYYEAWQGNGVRYSSGSVVLNVTPVAVSIAQSSSGVSGARYVTISNHGLPSFDETTWGSQEMTCNVGSCVAWYDVAAGSISETYTAILSVNGTTIQGWTGCSGSSSSINACPLTFSSDKNIFLRWVYKGI